LGDRRTDGYLPIGHDAPNRHLQGLFHLTQQHGEGVVGGRQEAAGQEHLARETIAQAPEDFLPDVRLEPIEGEDNPALRLRQAPQTCRVLEDLALPETVVAELEGRLRSQHKLLSKIVGVMFPPPFGCRTPSELCRVRGWDKNWPSRLLGAMPKRSWLKRLRRLGLEVIEPLWRHVASKSPAPQSRWQWTWVFDDSVFRKYGEQLGLVGTW